MDRPVSTPLMDSNKLWPLGVTGRDSDYDIQPVHNPNVPRRVSKFVKVWPDRSGPERLSTNPHVRFLKIEMYLNQSVRGFSHVELVSQHLVAIACVV